MQIRIPTNEIVLYVFIKIILYYIAMLTICM